MRGFSFLKIGARFLEEQHGENQEFEAAFDHIIENGYSDPQYAVENGYSDPQYARQRVCRSIVKAGGVLVRG